MLANMENSSFITDDEWNFMIDAQATELYDKLIGARGQEYYAAVTEIATVADQRIYSLPADYYQGLGVHARKGNGSWYRLDHFDRRTVDRWLNVSKGAPQVYRFRGMNGNLDGVTPTVAFSGETMIASLDQIEVHPVPTAGHTLRVEYIPVCYASDYGEEGSGDNVIYNGVNGWTDWIVYAVVALALTKEESDATTFWQLAAKVEQRIEQLAGARDAGTPERVVDARGGLEDFDIPMMRRY
jgi:hypothetical protein